MTDTAQQNVDIANMTPAELAAFAARLGVPVEQLKTPDYPDFRDTKGYHLRVTAAQNKKSKLGSDQVELTVYALDENASPVKRARGKLWLTYPFDNEVFRFKDADSRERSLRDLTTLLRCEYKFEKQFDDYYSRVQEGNKNRYFDAEGKELIGKAFTAHKNKVRIAVLQELHRRKEGDGSDWVDTDFFAQYKINEKDGVTYKNWQRLSVGQSEGVEYIFQPAAMMQRAVSGEAVNDDGEELF